MTITMNYWINSDKMTKFKRFLRMKSLLNLLMNSWNFQIHFNRFTTLNQ